VAHLPSEKVQRVKIAEIYFSIQGEGLLTGTESVFVRTSGCNLRCWFCDTPFTSWSPEGDDLSVDEIIERVDDYQCDHVVLTGGEPMLYAELVPLAAALKRQRRHITIETAGTLFLPVPCDLMSISPKLANSTPAIDKHPQWGPRHERSRYVPDVIRQLVGQYEHQIKFVVDQPEDFPEIESYLQEFPEIQKDRVLLMPQGTNLEQLGRHAAWLKPYCREKGFRFCPRRHIEWFGLVRGT
jgi:7-carboxy-7-deazaguanine synthase